MRTTMTAILLCAGAAQASRIRPTLPAWGGTVTYHQLSRIDEHHTKLELVLASNSRDPHEVTVPLELPAGFVVTGLALVMPNEPPVIARIRPEVAARAAYDHVVDRIKDPAIVDWRDDQHVMLRVFPVARGAAATITLELTDMTKQAHVTEHRALVAVPGLLPESTAGDADYIAYWPSHDD